MKLNIFSQNRLKTTLFLALTLSIVYGTASAAKTTSPRERTSFDKGWKFLKYGLQADNSYHTEPEGLQNYSTIDRTWRELDLPHDWAIEGPFIADRENSTGKRPLEGIGWYRKHFTIPIQDHGRRIFIEFDGAMSLSKVWINGKYLGEWPYGYASFRFELTDHLNYGRENVLAVRLDNQPQSSRWYPGAGIYRHTWLVKTSPLHIDHWGTYITTPKIEEKTATINIKAQLKNDSGEKLLATVSQQISPLDSPKKILAKSQPQQISIASNTTQEITSDITLKKPKLWSIEKPYLYNVKTIVKLQDKIIDEYDTTIGIRKIEFKPDQGFFLNDQLTELNGVCLHHDLGPIGTAVHTRAIERQLEILKEMGCNSIRTSHNMPAPDLLEACDKMGFVVLDEAFDCWVRGKRKNDYSNHYKEWHEKDVRAMVQRDRNHPSIIMWSSGNEINEQGETNNNFATSRELTKIFHEEDPTRPVTVGCNWPDAAKNGFAETVDIFGFNYKPHMYKEFRERYPDQPVYSSESASCISSRGEYYFPVSNDKSKGFFSLQVSSYDLYAPGWAMPPDTEFRGQDEVPAVLGEYVWTGFDYIGEPTPYNDDTSILLNYHNEADRAAAEKLLKDLGGKQPSRSSYFGIMDLCGFKKDRFYIYQARWRPQLKMAHILPHWNWPDRIGKVTPVHVYTTGDEAELYLNGKYLGKQVKGQYEYRLRWDNVIYEPGELKVVVYKNGKKWTTETIKTTGKATSLDIQPDRKKIAADGKDLCYLTVTVTDEKGNMVPQSMNSLKFSIEGPGEIIATGNGNAIDQTSFQSLERNAYNGLCLVVVRSIENRTGKITIKAESKDLKTADITIKSK